MRLKPVEQTMLDYLAELWAEGKTRYEMAELTGLSYSQVNKTIAAHRPQFPDRSPRRQSVKSHVAGTRFVCGHVIKFPASAPQSGDRVWCRTCDAGTYVGKPVR